MDEGVTQPSKVIVSGGDAFWRSLPIEYIISGVLITLISFSFAAKALFDNRERAQIATVLYSVSDLKKNLAHYWMWHGKMPETLDVLDAWGLSTKGGWQEVLYSSEQVQGLSFDPDGSFHVSFRFKYHPETHVQVLSFRPAFHIHSPSQSPLWVCGYATAVIGTSVKGNNRTTVEKRHLPSVCGGKPEFYHW